MLKIEVPRIERVMISEDGKYGKFVVEPLIRGFGTTLGSSLRRILLSSLPGAAVTSIQIDGVHNEFSSIDGIEEDVAIIILNIKKISMNIFSDDEKELMIDVHRTGTITAADISHDSDVEILIPDLHLATLVENVHFRMRLTAKRGRGYVPAEQNKREGLQVGVIPIDSIYTPVTSASYLVENTRVGQLDSFERLSFELWTDGSLGPSEAICESAKMFNEHLSILVGLNPESQDIPIMEEQEEVSNEKEILKLTIEDLDFSVRSFNSLKRSGINTIQDLANKSEEDIRKLRNLGQKSLKEILDKLESLGIIVGKDD
ncbi:DNA-directed RNA polymerase subunit alpha [Bacillus sp. ISL-40]|uniref:DNA-directed RNA polymerase subunit alpha n=1 Tax=unclassified Bacillus (in: firmicutes) TaxID=185979 RepID=UPI001BE72A73|nr:MULTISPECIES: DNA-directed RNA polymerase subunit alpha [unclassified Bacillus (in: firmicutes)]MBT2701076.1 DNA-directed RNA polymerase subunit alpha [Bacillus sp. ISL-40]MBT2741043.1 DNA-directed RNA polymerase subunit alpha [Bacillus sp. ISL-77]